MIKYTLLIPAFLLSILCIGQNAKKSSWHITADDIDPTNYYGVTVANGMVGIVSSPEPMKVKDVVLNGVYDNYQRGRVSNILKTFNHVNLDIDIDNQGVFSNTVTNYRQTLDMKQAQFITAFDVGDKASVTHKVMSLRHLPFTALVVVTIKAKKDLTFVTKSTIQAPDHLSDVRQFFAHIDRPHVSFPLMTSVADSPSGEKKVAASSTFIFPEEHGNEPHVIHEDWDFNRHWAKFSKTLKAGETYEFALVASSLSSEHFSDPQNEVERLTIYGRLEGKERLLQRHKEAWEKLWKSDIGIKGDLRSQREVRSALYHLYSFAREGTPYSLSPMGLSGLGYNGHVFWDTELWMYPPLLVLQPGIAKSLLEYRFQRLEAARQNAFAHGYKGAQFPWESADDGSEDTPVWALTGPFEHHITGCVGWAFWKYYQVTGDKEWLKEKGWPVLREVADFWASRVERNGPGKYDIKNVIGANEWEENIDNNAFTNAIAKLTLSYATQAADILDTKADPDWAHVAANIPILQFPDGVTRENATYNGSMIKQADVNLLAFPLQFIQDRSQVKKDLTYYETKMAPNGPAMGFCVLATLYAQLGETEKAFDIFVKSYRPNAVPPFGVLSETAGGTNPYFATGAGGMLQTVIFGFGGLEIGDQGVIETEKRLPKEWKALEIKGWKKR
ncbi:glycoside hydrolase family 65 protein [Fulvivirga sp. M361]|uniref:glycoside hydrolase family 65 protein n=1 Tax=Fulvivirga sp. M361 TaxID=2594266 RepID=UPI001179C645|nr:glycoside hydrolase family 65 protein [Fulvivirga sp. M361]TRX59924.1 glycoside hydrolase family 65 protein [Fulvivirga sp. M361]